MRRLGGNIRMTVRRALRGWWATGRLLVTAGTWRQSGFTLLEILVAITLLALVAGTVTLGLRGPGRALEEAERQGEMDRQLSRTLRRLHDDLAAVPRAAALDFIAAVRAEGERDGELLRCVTRAGVDFEALKENPRLVRVHYRLAHDPLHPGELLLYRGQTDWAPSGEEKGEELLLCRSVRRLTCSFQDNEGQAFTQWPPVESDGALLDGERGAATARQDLLPPAQVHCRLERWLDIGRGMSNTVQLAVLLPTGTGQQRGKGTDFTPFEGAAKVRRR